MNQHFRISKENAGSNFIMGFFKLIDGLVSIVTLGFVYGNCALSYAIHLSKKRSAKNES